MGGAKFREITHRARREAIRQEARGRAPLPPPTY
jgi:hypothetical protein